MTKAPLSSTAAQRVFLTLSFTRWFPVGLVVGILLLFQLDRGLSVTQALTASAVSGLVVFLLELPTSSFADGFGRRPVYVLAACVNVAASGIYLVAHSFWMFATAACLMGLFRALDSGPLEAWFVDTVHLSEPGRDVDGPLAKQGAVLGGGVAAGALLSGALVWWHPVPSQSALTLPVLIFAGLNVLHLCAVLTLMREPAPVTANKSFQRAMESARQAPIVMRAGARLLRSNRVLLGLVLVEVFWAIAMVVFEQFQPIRLAELLGSAERAGAWMGPVAAAGWAVFAVGSTIAGVSARRIGITRTAILARALNSLGAIAMGLVAGPALLVAAYLSTYALHGGAGPVHAALLHREASASNRATVLSMNSMMSFAAFSAAAPLLGLLAAGTSNQTAMVTAGTVSLLGILCYLPALRHERTTSDPMRDACRPPTSSEALGSN